MAWDALYAFADRVSIVGTAELGQVATVMRDGVYKYRWLVTVPFEANS